MELAIYNDEIAKRYVIGPAAAASLSRGFLRTVIRRGGQADYTPGVHRDPITPCSALKKTENDNMTPAQRTLFATSSMAALLACGIGHAHATPVHVNGGGSTLQYPTDLAEFTDYYTINPAVIFGNGKPAPNPAPNLVSFYGAVGSGAGTNAFLTNTATLLNGGSVGTYLYTSGSTTTAESVPAPVFAAGTVVHYGASDATITQAQVTAYTTGSGLGTVDGPLIQLPAFGTPITVPFSDLTATAVTLTDKDLCGIFSGKFTNWNQTSAAAHVAAGAIEVGFRGDSSGTSFLLTSHLAKVCTTGTNGNSNITFVAGTNFAANFTTGAVPANFVPSSGSGGVQKSYLAILGASTSTRSPSPAAMSTTPAPR